MALKVALQMDPLADVDIAADTTFRLALEAQARGHELFHYTPERLSWREGRALARGWPVTVAAAAAEGDHARFGPLTEIDLADQDLVLLRQDPPFDMAYVASTHILEAIHPKTLVVNDPAAVRNAPEKILVNRFRDFTPPTLISRDLDALKAFREAHGDIVVKPLFGHGGAGVFRVGPADPNLNALHEMFTGASRDPFVAQKFLPDVTAGDKRVLLIDGAPVGAINRVPAAGETRSNMHVGGRPEPATLTARDQEICAAIGPELRARGLTLVGIDVIGGVMTEINVTSPTGVQELERFSGVNAAALFWEAVERLRAETAR